MDLYSFIKGSNVINLIAILLVFLFSFSLILSEIGVLIWAKRKRSLYIFIVLAFLPLVIALADAAFRTELAEWTLARLTDIEEPVRDMLRDEYRKGAYTISALGLVGTAIPLAIGGLGLLFKQERVAAD